MENECMCGQALIKKTNLFISKKDFSKLNIWEQNCGNLNGKINVLYFNSVSWNKREHGFVCANDDEVMKE